MRERLESGVRKVSVGLRGLVDLILPNDVEHFPEPRHEGSQYTGRYDDPRQLAEVARRLGERELAAQFLEQTDVRVS